MYGLVFVALPLLLDRDRIHKDQKKKDFAKAAPGFSKIQIKRWWGKT